MIIKQKFLPNWSENFLFSKTFEFRFISGYILLTNMCIFCPNFFSAPIAQWQSVRLWIQRPGFESRPGPLAQLFFLQFFRFFALVLLYYYGYLPSFFFSKLFSSYLPSSTLFSNPNGFFSKRLARPSHKGQNAFSKRCSPCGFTPKNAFCSVRIFFG